jgi:hypothetical protein
VIREPFQILLSLFLFVCIERLIQVNYRREVPILRAKGRGFQTTSHKHEVVVIPEKVGKLLGARLTWLKLSLIDPTYIVVGPFQLLCHSRDGDALLLAASVQIVSEILKLEKWSIPSPPRGHPNPRTRNLSTKSNRFYPSHRARVPFRLPDKT